MLLPTSSVFMPDDSSVTASASLRPTESWRIGADEFWVNNPEVDKLEFRKLIEELSNRGASVLQALLSKQLGHLTFGQAPPIPQGGHPVRTTRFQADCEKAERRAVGPELPCTLFSPQRALTIRR